MPAPAKIWKTHPAYFVALEILKKKGAMADTDLFETLSEDFADLGFKDFNELLMRLEISGRITITSLTRGKRRVELKG
ncbi:MAG TPA: hypothetical protein VMT26_04035 [Candidatus Bathyarchaeia archaeon]|jgi:hypothetical protein|nr:hypothetical protein [Candidatus Bathyarchaeia archaeon]